MHPSRTPVLPLQQSVLLLKVILLLRPARARALPVAGDSLLAGQLATYSHRRIRHLTSAMLFGMSSYTRSPPLWSIETGITPRAAAALPSRTSSGSSRCWPAARDRSSSPLLPRGCPHRLRATRSIRECSASTRAGQPTATETQRARRYTTANHDSCSAPTRKEQAYGRHDGQRDGR